MLLKLSGQQMPMDKLGQLRLGLTMRVVEASGYYEPRDALAHDWQHCLQRILPGACWMPIPNIGEGIITTLETGV